MRRSVVLALLFAAILTWFSQVDFYHTAFSESGARVALYNLFRFLFIFYIGWLIYFPGYLLIRQKTPEGALLAFFSGIGIWTIVLLGAGFAGWYQKPLAISLALLVMAMSLPHLAEIVRAIKLPHYSRAQKIMGASALLAMFLFLQVKAIYPGGWHDYFSHYFFYYREVVETGSLTPNQLWYHFFYSKAGGLYFFAMLLTDPLAPSLVAAAFILAGGVLVYRLISRISTGVWPLAAIVPYFALQIYIRGAGYGSWGHLPKFHELTAVLFLFVFWASITLPEQEKSLQKTWLLAMVLASIAAVWMTLLMGFVLGAYYALLCAYYFFRKQRLHSIYMFLLGTVCAVAMIVICLINYAYTGILTDYALQPLWGHLGFSRIQDWGVLFEILSTLQERIVASPVEWSPNLLLRLFYRFLRLELVYVLLVAAALAAMALRRRPQTTRSADAPYYIVVLLVTVLFAFSVGAGNPVSFYRFSSFAFAPVLCMAFYALARSKLNHTAAAFILVVVCVAVSYSRYDKSDVIGALTQAGKFASGTISIDDAYSKQFALPADAYAKGVIHPAARAAYELVGAKTRIWAFTPYNYCLLPDCGVETHISFRMTQRPMDVFFGNAVSAKTALQAEGLDYFLITTSLEIRDPLPKAELFSPKYINRYLHVAWTDGDSALLTWPSKNTKPISKEWLEKYSKAVAESGYVNRFPFEKIGEYMRELDESMMYLPPLTIFH